MHPFDTSLKSRNHALDIPQTVVQKKICMLGDFAVGKTSLVRRYVEGRFDERYLSSIGVKVNRRVVQLPQSPPMHLLIWDLAGGEDFNGPQSNYLYGAAGALLVCDLTRENTLAALENYAARLRLLNTKSALLIAGNKSDLENQIQVTEQRLANFSLSISASWFTTSAKTGEGVETAFINLAGLLLKND